MNNDNLNSTDDLFRKELGNLSEPRPSDKEWERLKADLAKEGLITTPSKTRRFIPFIIGGIVLVSALIGYMNSTKVASVKSNVIVNNSTKPKIDDSKNTNIVSEKINSESTPAVESRTNKTGAESASANQQIETKDKKVREEALTFSGEVKVAAAKKKEKQPAIVNSENTIANSTIVAEKETKLATHLATPIEASTDILAQQKNSDSQNINENMPAVEVKANEIADIKEAKSSSLKKEENDSKVEESKMAEPANNSATENIAKSPGGSLAASSNQPTDSTSEVKTADVPNPPSTPLTSQTPDAKKEEDRKRLHVGVYLSWDINHYQVKNSFSSNYSYPSTLINGSNGLQFTAGLTGGYSLNDKVEIESGLFYSKKKKVFDNITTPVFVYDDWKNPTSENIIYNYNAKYLEVMAKIKYHYWLSAKNSIYLATGAIASFNFPEGKSNLSYFSRTVYSDSVWIQHDKIYLEPSSASISALVAIGFETTICDRWSIFVEPSYKYAFNPVIKLMNNNDYYPVNHFWRTVSAGAGVRYSF